MIEPATRILKDVLPHCIAHGTRCGIENQDDSLSIVVGFELLLFSRKRRRRHMLVNVIKSKILGLDRCSENSSRLDCDDLRCAERED